MSTLADITDVRLRKALGNRCLSYPTLAINAASAATIKTTGTTTYTVDGVIYQKAALSAQAITITHDQFGRPVSAQPSLAAYVQPISTTVYYVVMLDASGNVGVIQGGYAGQTITVNNQPYVSNGGMPTMPDGYTPIGVIKVATNGSTTFTPATTALDAAGVTATYFNVSTLPTATL